MFMFRTKLQETFVIQDCNFYSIDGTGMNGTYTTASDGTYNYITGCHSDTAIPLNNMPSNFEFTYKYYNAQSGSQLAIFNSLWNIGSDANNGVLIGCETDGTRIRIYNRSGGSNTVQQTSTNAFNLNTWVTVTIKRENNVWSVSIGSNSINYSKTFNPSFIKLNGDFTSTRITDLKIKAL